jgi:hypothetical protein
MLAPAETGIDGTFAPIVLGPHRRLLEVNLTDDDLPSYAGHKLGHLQREALGAGATQGGDNSD